MELRQIHQPLLLQGGQGPWDTEEICGGGEWGKPETNLERLLAAAAAIGPDLQCKVIIRVWSDCVLPSPLPTPSVARPLSCLYILPLLASIAVFIHVKWVGI